MHYFEAGDIVLTDFQYRSTKKIVGIVVRSQCGPEPQKIACKFMSPLYQDPDSHDTVSHYVMGERTLINDTSLEFVTNLRKVFVLNTWELGFLEW